MHFVENFSLTKNFGGQPPSEKCQAKNYPKKPLDKGSEVCYIVPMKADRTKARVNPDRFMGSASREHKVKKGKGSFRRNPKHKAKEWL